MQCPVCSLPLIAVERDQIEVDSCISCHGLWFDRGEMELLCEKTGVTLDMPKLFVAASVPERPRECPRCRKRMAKVALAANARVVTDHCPDEHGIWFDARELGTVIDAAASAETPMVRFLGEVFGKSR
ncbi:MAG TPA: zf-TFIIB domain-containing protein [Thermoanaerobaculia bacterium]|nr:zf-TFIIB domain-containing protein [Thermoanaerobaculia bacterium]